MNGMRVKTKRIISVEGVLVSLTFKFICFYMSDGEILSSLIILSKFLLVQRQKAGVFTHLAFRQPEQRFS